MYSGVRVVGAVLAAGARELAEGHAVAEEGGVLEFMTILQSGSTAAWTSPDMALVFIMILRKGVSGSQAAAMSSTQYWKKRELAPVEPSEPISSLSQKMRQLVYSGSSASSRALKSGIDADAVVLAVTADNALVEAHVAGASAGHGFQFGGNEVVFADAVFFVQQLEHAGLHGVLGGALSSSLSLSASTGSWPMMMLSFFRVEGFGELEIAVLVGEMRQQIGNGEHGFVFVFAEADADDFAVGFHDDAVNGQRTGKPLILAQAAVVVGFGLSTPTCSMSGCCLRSRRGLSVWALMRRMPSERGLRPLRATKMALPCIACQPLPVPKPSRVSGVFQTAITPSTASRSVLQSEMKRM